MQDEQIPAYTIESLKSTDSETKDFDFFSFEYFARDIEHLKAPHRHHFYTFILVTGGSGSHDIDFQKYDLVAGRLFLIAPGQVHAWNELKRVKGFVALFNESFMALSKGRKMMSAWPLFRYHQSCYFDLEPEEQNKWIEKFNTISEEITIADEFSDDSIFNNLSALLVRASRMSRRTRRNNLSSGQGILFKFQELIERHFTMLSTPKQYAELLNITPNYLNSVCKKTSGITAGELIHRRILLESKRLLAHTQLTVSEIAFRLSFEDNSYFCRFFKKNIGVTAEIFRARQLKTIS